MTTHNNQENDRASNDVDGFTLTDLTRLIREYRTVIRLTLLAIAVAFVISAIAAYVLLPAERTSNLKVRLTFRGADVAEYPNGTTFSPTEIISPAVLAKVYQQNGLDRFMGFSEFKSSIFITQKNDELEAMASSYRAKLADPKLTSVDRARIEQEFQEKQKSLSKGDLSVVLVSRERLRKVPVSTREKILNDVLSTWAEQTIRDKGILLYDVSILSRGVFSDIGTTMDYLVAADLLRTKISQIQVNIEQLLDLPGAKVLRTRKSNRSLAEVRAGFEDMRIYRIQPLIGMLMRNGVSRDAEQATEFLQSAVTFSELRVQEAQGRVSAIRDALERYSRQEESRVTEIPSSDSQNSTIDASASFLDRILALSVEGTDQAFRQKLVDDYRDEVTRSLPIEADARYYRDLQATFRARRTPTSAEVERIERDIQTILADARRMTDEVNEIYAALSNDLNPSTSLYVINAPVAHLTERPVVVSTYVLVGILLLFAAFPAVVIGCAIHKRFFTDEREEVTAASGAPTAMAARTHESFEEPAG